MIKNESFLITPGAHQWSVIAGDRLRAWLTVVMFADVGPLHVPPPLTHLGSEWSGLLERWEAARHGEHRQLGGHVWQDSHGGPDQFRPTFQWNHLQQRSHRSVQLYLRQAADRVTCLLLQHHVWPGEMSGLGLQTITAWLDNENLLISVEPSQTWMESFTRTTSSSSTTRTWSRSGTRPRDWGASGTTTTRRGSPSRPSGCRTWRWWNWISEVKHDDWWRDLSSLSSLRGQCGLLDGDTAWEGALGQPRHWNCSSRHDSHHGSRHQWQTRYVYT